MNGHSTATSMVEVANTLIGEADVVGLNMPLNMKAEDMYKEVKNMALEIDSVKDILLLQHLLEVTYQ